jgi:serine-type D-Ala-D-Ala carboxypeptidase (penicillin-binding protein 5/6)
MKHFLASLIIVIMLLALVPSKPASANFSVGAASAILMDQDTGRILYEKNANQTRRIASITKIMTAILAIESGKLNDTFKISENAVRTEGSSLYLKAGEKRKLVDLVYGLMLRSGNDAANAIAEHVGGSVEGFVFLMNQKAREIGMLNTHFSNPSGLDDSSDHFSTAYDMAVLTRYAMENKMYEKIAGTKMYKGWKNKNRLLTEKYKYCTGGKTGFTKLARRTLVTTASKDGENLISVTLNDSDDWNDHISMYEYGFKNYHPTIILEKGSVNAIKTKYLKNHVYMKREVVYPLQKQEEPDIRVDYELVKPSEKWKNPKKIPDIVGKAVIYMDNKPISRVPIYYSSEKLAEKTSWIGIFKQVLFIQLGVMKNG